MIDKCPVCGGKEIEHAACLQLMARTDALLSAVEAHLVRYPSALNLHLLALLIVAEMGGTAIEPTSHRALELAMTKTLQFYGIDEL